MATETTTVSATSERAGGPRFKDPVSGLTHLGGFAVGLVGVAWLFLHGAGDLATRLAMLVYGASLLALYAASSVYHLRIADEETTRRLRLLDHSAIFLYVAGSATPLFLRGLGGSTRVSMLAGIWAVAVLGIALKLTWRSAPRLVYTGMYVAMGWGAALQWPALSSTLPPLATACVVAGGVVYTLGALVYASKRPDPFPKVFGFHEIWHLFVLGGSALHFAAIAVIV